MNLLTILSRNTINITFCSCTLQIQMATSNQVLNSFNRIHTLDDTLGNRINRKKFIVAFYVIYITYGPAYWYCYKGVGG